MKSTCSSALYVQWIYSVYQELMVCPRADNLIKWLKYGRTIMSVRSSGQTEENHSESVRIANSAQEI
jgi:hypothetical protein